MYATKVYWFWFFLFQECELKILCYGIMVEYKKREIMLRVWQVFNFEIILQCHGLFRVTESLRFMPNFKLSCEFGFSFHLSLWTLNSGGAWHSTVPDSSLLTTNKINILSFWELDWWWPLRGGVQKPGGLHGPISNPRAVSALRIFCPPQLEMLRGLWTVKICSICVLLSKDKYLALKIC